MLAVVVMRKVRLMTKRQSKKRKMRQRIQMDQRLNLLAQVLKELMMRTLARMEATILRVKMKTNMEMKNGRVLYLQ